MAEATNATVCFLEDETLDEMLRMKEDDQVRFAQFLCECLQFASTIFFLTGTDASFWFLMVVMVLKVSIKQGFEVGQSVLELSHLFTTY